jgi:hypothetical protein
VPGWYVHTLRFDCVVEGGAPTQCWLSVLGWQRPDLLRTGDVKFTCAPPGVSPPELQNVPGSPFDFGRQKADPVLPKLFDDRARCSEKAYALLLAIALRSIESPFARLKPEDIPRLPQWQDAGKEAENPRKSIESNARQVLGSLLVSWKDRGWRYAVSVEVSGGEGSQKALAKWLNLEWSPAPAVIAETAPTATTQTQGLTGLPPEEDVPRGPATQKEALRATTLDRIFARFRFGSPYLLAVFALAAPRDHRDVRPEVVAPKERTTAPGVTPLRVVLDLRPFDSSVGTTAAFAVVAERMHAWRDELQQEAAAASSRCGGYIPEVDVRDAGVQRNASQDEHVALKIRAAVELRADPSGRKEYWLRDVTAAVDPLALGGTDGKPANFSFALSPIWCDPNAPDCSLPLPLLNQLHALRRPKVQFKTWLMDVRGTGFTPRLLSYSGKGEFGAFAYGLPDSYWTIRADTIAPAELKSGLLRLILLLERIKVTIQTSDRRDVGFSPTILYDDLAPDAASLGSYKSIECPSETVKTDFSRRIGALIGLANVELLQLLLATETDNDDESRSPELNEIIHRTQDLEERAKLLERLLGPSCKGGDDAMVMCNLERAALRHRLGDRRLAFDALQSAVQSATGDLRARLQNFAALYAFSLVPQGLLPEADFLRELSRLHDERAPNSADFLRAKYLLWHKTDRPAAMRLLEQVLQRTPRHALARYLLFLMQGKESASERNRAAELRASLLQDLPRLDEFDPELHVLDRGDGIFYSVPRVDLLDDLIRSRLHACDRRGLDAVLDHAHVLTSRELDQLVEAVRLHAPEPLRLYAFPFLDHAVVRNYPLSCERIDELFSHAVERLYEAIRRAARN